MVLAELGVDGGHEVFPALLHSLLELIRSLRRWVSDGGPSRRKAARCWSSIAANALSLLSVATTVVATSCSGIEERVEAVM